jgi:hypothetical protein
MFRNRQILILNNRIAAERWPDEGKTRTERTENPAGKPLGLQYLFQEAIALLKNGSSSTAGVSWLQAAPKVRKNRN